MATAAGYFDRKPSSSIRPNLTHLQPDPSSPHTPSRAFSSTFSSPSGSYRVEEEFLVFEFGARHLSAGFAGESCARCRIGFGPEESRRVGDYRKWLPGYEDRPRGKTRINGWGGDHELWRMDLRNLDLGLVEDKIERAVRKAYTNYLLLDSKSRKIFLVLPSLIPHQLLSTVLSTLFQNFQMPSIMLLSPPILATVAAGCRSGLIVDIGWRETVITAIYEYREVQQKRTTRAMKLITLNMAKVLAKYDHHSETQSKAEDTESTEEDAKISVDLEQAEEATVRMAWCKVEASCDEDGEKTPTKWDAEDDKLMTIPSPSSPRKSIQVPFSAFSTPAQNTFFPVTSDIRNLDDQEQPLDRLVYKSLLALQPDIRGLCMSRIMVTGGGSHIPGLKSRLLEELRAIVQNRGWDGVIGEAADKARIRPKAANSTLQNLSPATGNADTTASKPTTTTTTTASQLPQIPDPIAEKLQREKRKDLPPTVSGKIRGVETLGAWAGASLLGTLRIKGIVDIDKDTYLQSGIVGAKKDGTEVSVMPARSFGPGVGRPGERVSWTLGGWA